MRSPVNYAFRYFIVYVTSFLYLGAGLSNRFTNGVYQLPYFNPGEAFSNHEHPFSGFSRVDFLYVDGETADTMFRETREFPVLSNFRVRVVKPEHLIALKLFSTSSNPQRAALDRADVDHLLQLKDLNREEVAGYLKKYAGTAAFPETEGPPHD